MTRPALHSRALTADEGAIAEEILRLVAEELGQPGEPPGFDEPLADRLDSLHLLSLVVAVEDRFHVILTDDDAASARSLADLARLVAERTQEPLPREEASP